MNQKKMISTVSLLVLLSAPFVDVARAVDASDAFGVSDNPVSQSDTQEEVSSEKEESSNEVSESTGDSSFVLDESLLDYEKQAPVAPVLGALAASTVASGTYGTTSWTLDSDGVLTFTAGNWNDVASAPWKTGTIAEADIKKIVFSGKVVFANTDASALFKDLVNLKELNLENFDTSNIQSMVQMFKNCRALLSFDFSVISLASVTDMTEMLRTCQSLRSVTFDNEAPNLTSMVNMFREGSSNLTSLDLSKLKVEKNVAIEHTFAYTSLVSIKFGRFLIDDILNNASGAFSQSSKLSSLDISETNITSLGYMALEGCVSMTELIVPAGFILSGGNQLPEPPKGKDVPGKTGVTYTGAWQVGSKGADFGRIYESSTALMNNWPIPTGVTRYAWQESVGLFNQVEWQYSKGTLNLVGGKLIEKYIGNWADITYDGSVQFPWRAYMTDIKNVVIDGKILPEVTANKQLPHEGSYNYLFKGMTNLETITGMDNICFPSVAHDDAKTEMYEMFAGCTKLSAVDLSSFTTTTTTRTDMFKDCTSLKSLTLSKDFRFAKNENLPAVTKTSDYAGIWGNTGSATRTVYNTTTDLLNYDGTDPGTYEWATNTYGITYDLNGGGQIDPNAPKNYTVGTGLATIESPTRTGYYFRGWKEERSGQLIASIPTNAVGAYKLIAQWEVIAWGTSQYVLDGTTGTVTFHAGTWDTDANNPWKKGDIDKASIKKIIFDGAVTMTDTTIGQALFKDLTNLESIEGLNYLNTSTQTTMQEMFANDAKLTTLDLSNFDCSKVTNRTNMLQNCSGILSFKLGAKTNIKDSNLPATSTSGNYNGYWGNIATQTVYKSSALFTANYAGAAGTYEQVKKTYNLSYNLNGGAWDSTPPYTYTVTAGLTLPTNVTKIGSTFKAWTNSQGTVVTGVAVDTIGDQVYTANWDLDAWGTSTWTLKDGTLSFSAGQWDATGNAPWKKDTSMKTKITKIIFTGKITMSDATTGSSLFDGLTNLAQIDNIENLNTSNLTTMASMFKGTKMQTLDLSTWNTGNVASMNGMFQNCAQLTSLDLSSLNVAKVTDTANMFNGCTSLEALDIKNFANSSLANTTRAGMFSGATKLRYLTLGKTTKIDNTSLPAVSTTGYNGFWGNLTTKTVYHSSTEFMANYAGTNDGKYEWVPNTYAIEYDMSGGGTLSPDAPVSYTVATGLTTLPTPLVNKEHCTFIGWKDENGQPISKIAADTLGKVVLKADWLSDPDTGYWGTSFWSINDGVLQFEKKGTWDSKENNPWAKDAELAASIKKIVFNGKIDVVDPLIGEELFANLVNLTEIKDLDSLQTLNFTTFASMFSGCVKLQNIDLHKLETDNVTSMANMFKGCTTLETVDMSNLVTSKVATMASMFEGCRALADIDLSDFDTASVTTFEKMFKDCSNAQVIDVANFNTAKATTVKEMFSGCAKLKRLDLRKFDTTRLDITTRTLMLYGCDTLQSIQLGAKSIIANTDLPAIQSTGVYSGYWGDIASRKIYEQSDKLMHDYDGSIPGTYEWLKKEYSVTFDANGGNFVGTPPSSYVMTDGLPASAFPTVTKPRSKFMGWTDAAGATVTNIRPDTFGDFTFKANWLDQVWGTSNWDIDGNGVLTFQAGTWNLKADKPWTTNEDLAQQIKKIVFAGKIQVEDSSIGQELFNGLENLEAIEGIENLDTSNMTDMSYMFCTTKLKSLDLHTFDTRNVVNMYGMFADNEFLETVNLAGFNTSKVTHLGSMFWDCPALKSADLHDFDTQNVYDFFGMFHGCASLQELDLRNFMTGNAKYTGYMFYGCTQLKTLDIRNFDMRNLEDKDYYGWENTFTNAKALQSITVGPDTDLVDTGLPLVQATGGYNGAWGNVATQTKFQDSNDFMSKYGEDTGYERVPGTYEWLKNTYKVTFNTYGGKLPDSAPSEYTVETGLSSLPFLNPKSADFSFVGWRDEKGTLVTNIPANTFGEVTLNAVWRAGDDAKVWGSSDYELDANGVLTFGSGIWDTPSNKPWTLDASMRTKIKKIVFKGMIDVDDPNIGANLFANLTNLETIEGLENLVTTRFITFANMFYNTKLKALDLHTFDTSNVVNMSGMFGENSYLTTLNLTGFSTENVQDMHAMFQNCTALKELNIRTFDMSAVTNRSNMFATCTQLQTLTIGTKNNIKDTNLPSITAAGYSGGWINGTILYKSSALLMENVQSGTYTWQTDQTRIEGAPLSPQLGSSKDKYTWKLAAHAPKLYDKFGEMNPLPNYTAKITNSKGAVVFNGSGAQEVQLGVGKYELVITHTDATQLQGQGLKALGVGASISSDPIAIVVSAPVENLDISYDSFVQGDKGWGAHVAQNGAESGTTGKSLRIESLKANIVDTSGLSGDIEYRTHIQGTGWTSYVKNGAASGVINSGKRMEAFQMRLTGELAERFDIYYCAHVQSFGWLDWAKNDEVAGSSGYSLRIESLKIQLVPKGDPAPGKTTTPYMIPISYQAHVQSIGWQTPVTNGATGGTTGQSKRVEAMKINIDTLPYAGTLRYKSHISTIGWEKNYVLNGGTTGTVGQSKRLEAIVIELTGEMAEHYDIYYRTHVQSFGWLGWAKNGAQAGSAGYGYRMESVQIKLVPKGGPAPGSTANPFKQK